MTDALLSRVAAHCRRHGLLPPGGTALAMVSGGPDSTCLLHVLAELHDGPLAALAVDHGMRPEGRTAAEEAVEGARRLGVPARIATLHLPPGASHALAREARYAAARREATRVGAAVVATGHTASDQAETVLMRMARGTGRTGALGMPPRAGDLVRPLLVVSAAQTRAWCRGRGLAVADDPANADPRYARSRARHGLLPALGALHPAAEAHVAAFADLLRDEAALLEPLVDAAWGRAGGGDGLRVDALAAEAPPLRRLLVRRLLAAHGAGGDALGAAAVERVLDAAARGARAEVPGAVVVVERGRLVVVPPPPPAVAPRPLAVPGAVAFGPLVLRARAARSRAPEPGRVWVRPPGRLTVRAPRPGDRVPLPGGGRQPVGRLLQSAGVPARLRPQVPVVCAGDRVVWVAGHRVAPDLVAPPGEPAVELSLEAP